MALVPVKLQAPFALESWHRTRLYSFVLSVHDKTNDAQQVIPSAAIRVKHKSDADESEQMKMNVIRRVAVIAALISFFLLNLTHWAWVLGRLEGSQELLVEISNQAKEVDDTLKNSGSKNLSERRLPFKPLDLTSRLSTVTTTKPMDLKKVDVAGDHSDHPHRGARDANGSFGYTHDPTALRKNPPPFHHKSLMHACTLRDATYHTVTEKVFVDLAAHEKADQSGKRRDKIFCLIYSSERNHDDIPFIRETWGPKCDGFMVASNKTNSSIDAVDIAHEGPEEYFNMWQKVRSMWAYVYDNFYDDFDWFHIGGDDMYLIVENLRLYLESDEIKTAANGGIYYLPNNGEVDVTSQVPLFLGCRLAFKGNRSDIFNAGGPGYTINKAALKLLVVQGLSRFFLHNHVPMEDVFVARIFRNLGVNPYDTKDETGGERYMHFSPGFYYDQQFTNITIWYDKYSIDAKRGLDHCAARSIAFHRVKKELQKRLHALLYHKCPNETNVIKAAATTR